MENQYWGWSAVWAGKGRVLLLGRIVTWFEVRNLSGRDDA